MAEFRKGVESDAEDFFAKIDWEGGVWSALEYGLKETDYDLPAEMAEGWLEIRTEFDSLQHKVEVFQARFQAEAT